MFDPAVGCDQGGPTPTTPGKAWDWYIENVKIQGLTIRDAAFTYLGTDEASVSSQVVCRCL